MITRSRDISTAEHSPIQNSLWNTFFASVNPKAVMFAIMVRGTEMYIGNTKIDNMSPDREVSDENN